MQSEAPNITTKKPPRYQSPRHPFDRRSRAAKRFASLVKQFSNELGGGKPLSEARLAMVRQLAGVILHGENMQAAIVRGEAVDAEQLVRVANLQSRLQRQLGLGQGKPSAAPQRTLKDKLAERGQE